MTMQNINFSSFLQKPQQNYGQNWVNNWKQQHTNELTKNYGVEIPYGQVQQNAANGDMMSQLLLAMMSGASVGDINQQLGLSLTTGGVTRLQ